MRYLAWVWLLFAVGCRQDRADALATRDKTIAVASTPASNSIKSAEPTASTEPVPSTSTVGTSRAAFDPATIGTVAASKTPACVFETKAWTSKRMLALHSGVTTGLPRVNSPTFALVQRGPVRVTLDVGSPPLAVIEVSRGNFDLRGYLENDSILHVTRPLLLGGVMALTPESELGVVATSPGKLVPTLAGIITFDSPLPAQPCTDFSLEPGIFTTTSLTPTVPKAAKTRYLAKAPIRISPTESAPFTGTFERLLSGSQVKVIRESGSRSFITFDVGAGVRGREPQAVVFGWVETVNLVDELEDFGVGGLGLTGTGSGGTGREPKPVTYVCDHEVPLYAEGSSAYWLVGSVHAGTPLAVRPSRVLQRLVAPTVPDVNVVESLWLANADTSKCKLLAAGK